jgi:hypothetical protein
MLPRVPVAMRKARSGHDDAALARRLFSATGAC